MPNRQTHEEIGAFAGGATALWMTRDEDPITRLIETIGGFFGGQLGGRLPDIIDPPRHPRHRSVGHAMIPAAIVGAKLTPHLRTTQERLRRKAKQLRARRAAGDNVFEQILYFLGEIVLLLASGALVGAAAGYASHLLLDLQTPMGLPLLS